MLVIFPVPFLPWCAQLWLVKEGMVIEFSIWKWLPGDYVEPLRDSIRPQKWPTVHCNHSHVLGTFPFTLKYHSTKSTMKVKSDHKISPATTPSSCHAASFWSQMFNHEHLNIPSIILIGTCFGKMKHFKQSVYLLTLPLLIFNFGVQFSIARDMSMFSDMA